jgi:Kef-type K+ transport system membrane component KefB
MDFLFPFTIISALLFALSFLSNRLNFFSIPLFIVGGIALKPYLNEEIQYLSILADLGLILLLFYIGFEISPIRYLKNIKKILFDGGIDLLITFLLPFLIILLMGLDIKLSLFIAALLYISSSAIGLKIIVDFRLAIFNFAEKAINILLFQDIIVSLLIMILPLMRVEFRSSSLFFTLSNVLIFTVFLIILYLLLKFTREILNRSSEETLNLLAFTVLMLTSFISERLINSMVLGAFMGGSIVKATGFRIDIKRSFTSLKDIFSPFFFFFFGLKIDFTFSNRLWLFILLTILLSLGTKYLVSYIICYKRTQRSESMNILFGLLTIRGEFSIVLTTLSYNYLNKERQDIISILSTIVIFVNMIVGLWIIKLSHNRLKKAQPQLFEKQTHL